MATAGGKFRELCESLQEKLGKAVDDFDRTGVGDAGVGNFKPGHFLGGCVEGFAGSFLGLGKLAGGALEITDDPTRAHVWEVISEIVTNPGRLAGDLKETASREHREDPARFAGRLAGFIASIPAQSAVFEGAGHGAKALAHGRTALPPETAAAGGHGGGGIASVADDLAGSAANSVKAAEADGAGAAGGGAGHRRPAGG